jgi:predicted MPP superfamily phosphohydrolase
LLAACALTVGVLLSLYAFLIEPYQIQIQEIQVTWPELPALPAPLQGLRIVQISDTHIRSFRPFERRIQEVIRALEPDLLLITGDLIEYAPAYDLWAARVREVGKFLEGLPQPRYGVWASLGNSDITRYGGHNDLLVRQVRQSGVNLLINEGEKLDITSASGEQASLYLLGVDFAHLLQGFAADARVAEFDGNRALALGKSTGNSFTHYLPGGEWLGWVGYEFSGRFYYADASGGLGILFGSRMPRGEDTFFRLRRYKDGPIWELGSRGVSSAQGATSSGLRTAPKTWYHFRARWERVNGQAHIQSRLWPEGEAEPAEWSVDCLSEWTSEVLTALGTEPFAGTIGFWGVDAGDKYFDDLEVRSLDGSAVLWREDFESDAPGSDPPHWLDFGYNQGNLSEALRDVPAGAFTILLAHSPDTIHEASTAGIKLVLSGHTHGGQVRLPLIGPLYSNTDLGKKYVEGLFRFENSWLYINRGLGTRAVPARFLAPPEIVVFTLQNTAER